MPSSLLGVVPHGNCLCQYNGYTFDPATLYTEGIDSRPVPDSSGRTVKAVHTETKICWRVFLPPSQGTIDALVESLKPKLMSYGGALYYREKGFGDWNINTPGGTKTDISWGPKPTHLFARPLADAYCWELHWGVAVETPWCPNARYANDLAEWVYQVFWDYDEGGYEGRRIQGHIEIPLTRPTQSDRRVRQTADDYRDVVAPECPRWFRPGPSYINLSEDRRRLTFGFNFQQLPGPVPPPGVLKVRMADSLRNDVPLQFAKWTWTLTGEYELVAGTPHKVAALHFIESYKFMRAAMQDQLQTARLAQPKHLQNDGGSESEGTNASLARSAAAGVVGIAGGTLASDLAQKVREGVAAGVKDVFNVKKTPDASKKVLILPSTWEASNPDRYDKPRANFTLTSMVAGTAPTLLTAGLWINLPGDNDYDRWRKTVRDAFGARGQLGGRFDPDDDVIIDLCQAGVAKLRGRKPRRPEPGPIRVTLVFPGGELPIEIDGDANWIKLKNDLEVVQHDVNVLYKPLPRDATLRNRQGGVLRTPAAAGALSKFVPPAVSEYVTTVAKAVASTYEVVMRGEAVRVGCPGTPPSLLSVAGVPAVPANDKYQGDGSRTTTHGDVGLPVYLTVWQLRYLLIAGPGTTSRDADTNAPAAQAARAAQVPAAGGPPAPGGRVAEAPPAPGRGLRRY